MNLKNPVEAAAFFAILAAAAAATVGLLYDANVITDLTSVLEPANHVVRYEVALNWVFPTLLALLAFWSVAAKVDAKRVSRILKWLIVHCGVTILSMSLFFLVLSCFVAAPNGFGADVAIGLMTGCVLALFFEHVLPE